MTIKGGRIELISPDSLKANPENPRMIFREEEMEQLLDSIQVNGILVPLTVFSSERTGQYVLLDGERRWRCAKKLNLKEIPVIVQPKPTKLENILLMFNIHHVRVQWDPLATANKLKELQKLLSQENKPNDLKTLAAMTGLTRGMINRYFDLLNLPPKYQVDLLRELEKPKSEREITPDLIMEIQQSARTIKRYVPEVLEGKTELDYLDNMVGKYKRKVVKNVVNYRTISKIARVERTGIAKANAVKALNRLISEPNYSIDSAYRESAQGAYAKRDIVHRIEALIERMESLTKRDVDSDLKSSIVRLQSAIRKLVD